MANVFGGIGAQTAVVLIVAVVAAVPVILYYEQTYKWFAVGYACLFVAAFATTFESLVLPTVLNVTEHTVGNLGAAVAFAVAAYTYRQQNILGAGDGDRDETALAEEA